MQFRCPVLVSVLCFGSAYAATTTLLKQRSFFSQIGVLFYVILIIYNFIKRNIKAP